MTTPKQLTKSRRTNCNIDAGVSLMSRDSA
jgi:hypothetical protein